MRIDKTANVPLLRTGLIVAALGLFCAPWILEFESHSIAAWSSWSLSVLYLAVGAACSPRTTSLVASALLALGLWTLLAPGILGFDMADPTAFWTHTIAGLAALRGSYVAFRDIDPGGMQTG